MVQNKLKLNQNKTEFLVLNAQHRPQPMIDYIKVNTDRVEPSFFLHEILVLSLIRTSPWRSTSHTYANHRFIMYVIHWNPSKPDNFADFKSCFRRWFHPQQDSLLTWPLLLSFVQRNNSGTIVEFRFFASGPIEQWIISRCAFLTSDWDFTAAWLQFYFNHV